MDSMPESMPNPIADARPAMRPAVIAAMPSTTL
jgi:hypothetical protein